VSLAVGREMLRDFVQVQSFDVGYAFRRSVLQRAHSLMQIKFLFRVASFKKTITTLNSSGVTLQKSASFVNKNKRMLVSSTCNRPNHRFTVIMQCHSHIDKLRLRGTTALLQRPKALV